MKLFLCAVRDRAADTYGQPFATPSLGGAIRGFGDQINDPREENVLYKHSDDFELYELGIYNDATAEFEILSKARQIAIGRDLRLGAEKILKAVK